MSWLYLVIFFCLYDLFQINLVFESGEVSNSFEAENS